MTVLRQLDDLNPIWILSHKSMEGWHQRSSLVVNRIARHRVRFLADGKEIAPTRINGKAAGFCLGGSVPKQRKAACLFVDTVPCDRIGGPFGRVKKPSIGGDVEVGRRRGRTAMCSPQISAGILFFNTSSMLSLELLRPIGHVIG